MTGEDFLDVAERAARSGGEALLAWKTRFSVRAKGPADLVTEADLASQEAIRQVVLGAFPEHGFLGEEGPPQESSEEYCWIVDPLDGTTNYVHGAPFYAVSVALVRGAEILAGVVFDPVSEECFTSSRGRGAWLNGQRLHVSPVALLEESLVAVSFAATVSRNGPEVTAFQDVLVRAQAVRRLGSAALNLAYVAAGRFDASYAGDTKPWDVAAGILLVQEASGIVTRPDGHPLTRPLGRYLAAANSSLHASLVPLVSRLA
jgi:myo-inositol-1(or 4)-monophosphatase